MDYLHELKVILQILISRTEKQKREKKDGTMKRMWANVDGLTKSLHHGKKLEEGRKEGLTYECFKICDLHNLSQFQFMVTLALF